MAKRTPRPKHAEPPAVTASDRVRALQRIFTVIARDHAAAGGSEAELAEAWRQFGEQGAAGGSDDSDHFHRLATFGRLLELWYSDANWLENGHPRPLKPKARNGFPALCRALALTEKPAALVSHGLSFGILVRTPDGSLLPKDRTALVTRPSPMILDMFSVGLGAWLGTARHNTQASTTEDDRRLDRGIFGTVIPAAVEDTFHRMAREVGRRCVDNIDNWLQAHRAEPDDRDVRRVTFHMFAASDKVKPAKRPKRKGNPRGTR